MRQGNRETSSRRRGSLGPEPPVEGWKFLLAVLMILVMQGWLLYARPVLGATVSGNGGERLLQTVSGEEVDGESPLQTVSGEEVDGDSTVKAEFLPRDGAEPVNGYYSPETVFDLRVQIREGADTPVTWLALAGERPVKNEAGEWTVSSNVICSGSRAEVSADADHRIEFTYEELDYRSLEMAKYLILGGEKQSSVSGNGAGGSGVSGNAAGGSGVSGNAAGDGNAAGGEMSRVILDFLQTETPAVDVTEPEMGEITLRQIDPDEAGKYCRQAGFVCEGRDDQSGIPEEAWSLDGEGFTALSELAVSHNGTYALWLRDGAGNVTSGEISVENIDDEAPLVTDISSDADDFVRGYGLEGTLRVEASDAKSGLAERAYSFDGGKTWQKDSFVTVSENGLVSLAVRDQCGNRKKVETTVRFIDRTGPSLVISGNPTGPVNRDVTLTLSAKDAGAGIASIRCRNNSLRSSSLVGTYGTSASVKEKVTITVNGSYTFTVTDGLGNETLRTVKVSEIDRSLKKSSSSSLKIGTGSADTGDTDDTEAQESIIVGGKTGSGASSGSVREIVMESDTEEPAEVMEISMTGEGEGDSFDPETDAEGLTAEYPLEEKTPEEPAAEVTTTETISENLAAPLPEVVYPAVEEKADSRGPVMLAAVLLALLLVAVLGFVLVKKGVIKLPEELPEAILKKKGEEE